MNLFWFLILFCNFYLDPIEKKYLSLIPACWLHSEKIKEFDMCSRRAVTSPFSFLKGRRTNRKARRTRLTRMWLVIGWPPILFPRKQKHEQKKRKRKRSNNFTKTIIPWYRIKKYHWLAYGKFYFIGKMIRQVKNLTKKFQLFHWNHWQNHIVSETKCL